MCHKANMLFNNKENTSSSNPYEWMNKNKTMIIEWITANIMKWIYLAVRFLREKLEAIHSDFPPEPLVLGLEDTKLI